MDGALFDRRFVIVAGKGGVGKSTMSAALALVAARQGKRVLIAELGSKERAARLLGHEREVGYQVTQVRERIDVINVQPKEALHEYGLIKLKFEKVYQTVFENPVMRSLTRMIPGMNELVLIGKAWYLEQETLEDGSPRWDVVIVDAPATGHGISLLVLPHVVTETVTVGPMYEETKLIRDMLVDPERTVMNIVSLPEEMPVSETLELRSRMDDTLRIQPGYLFINGIWPEGLSTEQHQALHQLGEVEDSRVREVLSTSRFMRRRRVAQEEHLARLRQECDMPAVEIGYQFVDEFGPSAVEAIADQIESGIERPS